MKRAAQPGSVRGDCDAPGCNRNRNSNPFAVLCDFHQQNGISALTTEQIMAQGAQPQITQCIAPGCTAPQSFPGPYCPKHAH